MWRSFRYYRPFFVILGVTFDAFRVIVAINAEYILSFDVRARCTQRSESFVMNSAFFNGFAAASNVDVLVRSADCKAEQAHPVTPFNQVLIVRVFVRRAHLTVAN